MPVVFCYIVQSTFKSCLPLVLTGVPGVAIRRVTIRSILSIVPLGIDASSYNADARACVLQSVLFQCTCAEGTGGIGTTGAIR